MSDASRRERRIKQRQEREDMIQTQRAQYRKRERTKSIINWSVASILVVAIGVGAYVMFLQPERPGPYDDFARCLTQKGAVMYGTDWCPHCQEQKRMFDTSFRYVNYINCDLNAAACDLASVEGYPTWTFPSGPSVSGEQELSFLSERTGCTLP